MGVPAIHMSRIIYAMHAILPMGQPDKPMRTLETVPVVLRSPPWQGGKTNAGTKILPPHRGDRRAGTDRRPGAGAAQRRGPPPLSPPQSPRPPHSPRAV